VFDVEDNAYKTPILAYSKELDFIISANSIIKSDVKEENSCEVNCPSIPSFTR
jgi:hypothetical protein